MERKLTAILCADVYGYSRLMGQDEEETLRTLSAYRKIIDSLIESHRGRFVNSAGDSVLAEFTSVVEAVTCAVEIQNVLKPENESLPPERRMEFRIGVNLGDVIAEGEQIYGDGVNVASRLENLAKPGGICISGVVHDQVKNKLALIYQDLGAQQVKNIVERVQAWRVVLDKVPAPPVLRRYWRRGVLSLTGLAIALSTFLLVQHLSLKPPRISASIPPQEKPSLPVPSMPSIAVLPFSNLSGDAQQEYFSDGISEQLIGELSRLPGLFVIARNSSFAYKGKAVRESEIGRELGVKYLLEGSVRKAAGRLRIGVNLVDAGSGTEKWSQQLDRPFNDVFAVQDEIVSKLVTTLGLIIKLDRFPKGAGAPRTENLEAFDDYLRAGEYGFRLTKEDIAKERDLLEKAIALDPKFAQAYAGLGTTYWWDAFVQFSRDQPADLRRALELAERALALDDSCSLALGLRSRVDWMLRRFDQAIGDARRAITIDPNYADGYLELSMALELSEKSQEGINAATTAARLDPAGRDFYVSLIGIGNLQMGRQREAIWFLKKHLGAYPNDLIAHLDLMIAYEELGHNQDARAEVPEVMRINPKFVLPPPETSWFKDVALNKRWEGELRKAGLK